MEQLRSVLLDAEEIINGPRQSDYGHPFDNFSQTAKLWSAAFGFEFTAEQVAIAMILVKVSRETNRPKRDNLVDIAGYAGTLEKVIQRRVEIELNGVRIYPMEQPLYGEDK